MWLYVISCFILKFYSDWRDVGWTPRIADKMTDFWKIELEFSHCQKGIDKGSWVSLALVTRLRNYKLLYFGSFTVFDVMSERPELSTKWRISGDLFFGQ